MWIADGEGRFNWDRRSWLELSKSTPRWAWRAAEIGVDLHESQAVLALLGAIPKQRDAAAALAELLSRRPGLERACEVLVAWAGRRRTESNTDAILSKPGQVSPSVVAGRGAGVSE
jgi:hypothetical protein